MLPTLMHALVPILFPALVPASGADIGAGLGHRYLSADLGAGKWCRHRCRTWASVPQCRQNPTKVYKPACLAVEIRSVRDRRERVRIETELRTDGQSERDSQLTSSY
jgi:hypothetical protein